MNAMAARSGGSASISGASVPLLMRGDVVDGLADGRDLLCVLVRDLDPELVLELHDQLDEVERVGVEILLERRFLCDVRLFDPELLGQDFLTRSKTSSRDAAMSPHCVGGRKRADHTTSVR